MPNHFHLLIQQKKDLGVTQYVSDISNSYTKYFNTKYKRTGRLHQGPFKAKEIPNEESLLQVSRYIHLNPALSLKVAWKDKLEEYPHSSYENWINEQDDDLVKVDNIGNLVKLKGSDYKEFVESKINTNPSIGIEGFILEKQP